MLHMISYIVGIDQNIIKIYYYTDIKEIEKDVIYKMLISKTKEYKDYSKNPQQVQNMVFYLLPSVMQTKW